jgi:shikimate 5-dehydrogenase
MVILARMHLVALISQDPELVRQLERYRDPLGRFHLHPLLEYGAAEILPALGTLEFAGALILDHDAQEEAAGKLSRRSLDAQEAGAVDTVSVSPGGLIGEYNFGRAVGALLNSAAWNGREASAVILGSGRQAMGVARELSSIGVTRLAILAGSRPEAERAVPRLAASTSIIARSVTDPVAERCLLETDLLVRIDPAASVPLEILGPHLTLLDLGAEPVSRLRQQALNVGALSFNRQDFQAHFLALALGHILGGGVTVEPFLSLLHES